MRRNSEASSSCRIERKRAHDREAQRASRAKTKQYIAHLEKTVADLTESSGDSRANYLAQHASQQSQEIDKLQSLVSKIRTLVQDASKSDGGSPGAGAVKGEGSSSTHATDGFAVDAFSALNWDTASEDQWVMDASRPVDVDMQQPAPQPAIPRLHIAPTSRNLVVLGISLFCENDDDTTYFPRLNEVIEKIEQTPDDLSPLPEDMDILIRAIVHGWDAAERVHHFDVVWRFLRAFDEGLWYRAQPVERFANFWNIRSTMLHKIRPKNQPRRKMAAFMSPTMGQRRSKHPSVVDYFGWPQVRDLVLNSGIHHTSGRAVIAFVENFHFSWPWEVRDIYKVNRSTGMYTFSEAFLNALDDQGSFQLTSNALIPFEVHPPSTPSPVPDFTNADSASAADDEFPHQEPTFENTAAQNERLPQRDTSPEDWMATLASLQQAGRTAMHDAIPRPMAHPGGLPQWPVLL